MVFGHPIGANQGVQFPLARAYTQVLAAEMMRDRAAALFDTRFEDWILETAAKAAKSAKV